MVLYVHINAMIYELQLSFGKYQADEQAWIETIKSVKDGETVRISTMDWLGQSEYSKQTVYWSSLSTAISEVPFLFITTLYFLIEGIIPY